MYELVGKLSHHQLIDPERYTLSIRSGEQMICVPLTERKMFSDENKSIRVAIGTAVPEELSGYQLHSELYKKNPDFNIIAHCHTPALMTISRFGKKVKPVLDDFAQLIGVNAKVVNSNNTGKVVSGIRNRNAVFLQNDGAICAACSEDDIFAVSFVLNKNSMALIKTKAIGGGKPICWIESALMHFVYKRYYSQNAKMKN